MIIYSEILIGIVLGKVIAICKNDLNNINLLQKTLLEELNR